MSEKIETKPTPSRYRLPQSCSPDRQRARRATLDLQRSTYQFVEDDGPGNPAAGFRLPIGAALLPPGEPFAFEKRARLAAHKLVLSVFSPLIQARIAKHPSKERDYERLVGWLRLPDAVHNWKSDAAFARQRLIGTNPMALRRCVTMPDKPLADAATRVLKECHHTTLNGAFDTGRLYYTDYEGLKEDYIQRQVVRGAQLAAAKCLFVLDANKELAPLAIQLMPPGCKGHAVVTPLDPPAHWLLARSHAQAADAHYHEAVYHLLETHMVSEVFALCTARQLHPDHPLNQLLKPHFQETLAINYLARHDLLSPGGPIDVVLAAGVGGALDLARQVWSSWSFSEHTLFADLEVRGVAEEAELPGYFYRDDACCVWFLLCDYVKRVLGCWYPDDKAVREDFELQAWCDELKRYVLDLPLPIDTLDKLITFATHIIFRASAQHSAVNNGQFQAYGFIPNAPGTVFAWPPKTCDPDLDMHDVLSAFANRKRATAQLGMAWVLSQPTHRSLLTTGESPAFSRDVAPAAHDATVVLRRRLIGLGEKIAERNRTFPVYTYLSPYDIGRSTAV